MTKVLGDGLELNVPVHSEHIHTTSHVEKSGAEDMTEAEDQPRLPLQATLTADSETLTSHLKGLNEATTRDPATMTFLPTSDSDDSVMRDRRPLLKTSEKHDASRDTQITKPHDTLPVIKVSGMTELIPPTAFLLKRDGTPMDSVPREETSQTMKVPPLYVTGVGDGDRWGPRGLGHRGPPGGPTFDVHEHATASGDDTFNMTFTTRGSAESTPRSGYGQHTDTEQGVCSGSKDNEMADDAFLSPAEEMVYIRDQLKKFKENKNKLRSVPFL